MSHGLSRRRFLQQTSLLAGTMLAASGRGARALAAQDGLLRRRHLITIEVEGGWDSLWFHNGVCEQELTGVLRRRGAIWSGDRVDLRAHLANLELAPGDQAPWHLRYRDADALQHPDGHTLGPGMSLYSPAELRELLIWRGLDEAEGGHQIGNRINNTGRTGSSTPSYTALVAHHLARDYVRGLHHVAVAQTVDNLYAQSGTLAGPAVGIPIPDAAAWADITSFAPQDQDAARRERVSRAVERVTGAVAARFQRPSSRDVYSTFLASFRSAVQTSSTGQAEAARFAGLVQQYVDEMTRAVREHAFSAWFQGAQFIDGSRLPTAPLQAEIRSVAFGFALAEQLVRLDLSAVVHLRGISGDFHSRLDDELLGMVANHAALRKLLRALAATSLGDGSGRSVLDVSGLVVQTEFDRAPAISVSGSGERDVSPGTNHWGTASLLLAGGLFARGRVIGDFQTGAIKRVPGGLLPAAEFASIGAYRGLPVDARSGRPDPGGIRPSNRAIFPTVLAAFGAESGGLAEGPAFAAALPRS